MTENEYFSVLKSELGEWKARMEHIINKFDSLSGEEEQKLIPCINDLNNSITELSNRIKGLANKYSRNYPSYSGEWEFKFGEINEPIEDVDALETMNPT